jgi:hypothetical protein
MLSRIGDYAQSNFATQLLLDAQTRTREAQVQISTGKKATRFRELAGDTNRLVSTKDTLQRIQKFEANNQLVASTSWRARPRPWSTSRPALGRC